MLAAPKNEKHGALHHIRQLQAADPGIHPAAEQPGRGHRRDGVAHLGVEPHGAVDHGGLDASR